MKRNEFQKLSDLAILSEIAREQLNNSNNQVEIVEMIGLRHMLKQIIEIQSDEVMSGKVQESFREKIARFFKI